MIKNYLAALDSYFFMDDEATYDDKKSFYTIAISVNILSIAMFLTVISNL